MFSLQLQHDSLAIVRQSYSTLWPSSSFLISVTKVIILCPVLLMRNWSQTFISGLMPSLVLTLSRRFIVYHRLAYKLQRASCASHGRTKQVFVGSSSSAAARPIFERWVMRLERDRVRHLSGPLPEFALLLDASQLVHIADDECACIVCQLSLPRLLT